MSSAIPNETVIALAQKYRNWGRWGDTDEVGALNFITAEHIANAALLAKHGHVFQLALPLDDSGPQNGAWGRVNPIHLMLQDGGDIAAGAQDNIKVLRYTDDAMYLVLQSSTQWDGLAHIFHEGQMYNGYGLNMVTSRGAEKNDIAKVADRMVGRGVLLDIPRFRGVEWLEPGDAISKDEIIACAALHDVTIGTGDFILVRTGALASVRAAGHWTDAFRGGPAPGLGLDVADLFCPSEVAAVATDTWGVEVLPNQTPDMFQPLHIVMLVNAGIHLGEMFDLEALAEDCAADGVYEFLFVAPPLTVTGAVGSAVTPLAIK